LKHAGFTLPDESKLVTNWPAAPSPVVFPQWKWERLGFSCAGAPSPSGFFFFFFFYKQVLFWVVGGGGFHDNWTLDLKKSYHHSGSSPMRPNELWTCPHDGTARTQGPGRQRNSCGSVRRRGDRCSQRRSWGGGWGSGHPRLSKGGQGEVGTSAISDRGCVSLGSLTMKPRDST